MELLKALRDRSLTSEERLKVACFIWHEGDVPIGSKESVLVKWISEEITLAYSKKTRAPPPVTVSSKLWEFLSIMVQALQLHPQDGFQASFSTFMIQCMNKVFAEASTCEDSDVFHCAESVLKSLDCILSLLPLPPVLYKYELMAGLVHSVMKLTLSKLISGKSPGEPSAGLKQLLKHYVYLQGTQGNQKKVFITTCGQLLEPVLMLRKLLSPSNSSSQAPELESEILDELDRIMASLFSRDHLPEFTSAVAAAGVEEEKRGEKRSATSYTKLLFQSLERFLESSNPGMHQAVVDNLPALLEAFLSQNSKENMVRKTVEFQFLCKLLHLLGYKLQKEMGLSLIGDRDVPGDFTPMEWCFLVSDLHVQREAITDSTAVEEDDLAAMVESESLDTLITIAECLNLVLKYSTYQVAEDKASGGKQFTQLQLLSSMILRRCKMNNLGGVFGCLSILLKLNHKIVEPHLTGIWLLIFTLCQGSEKMEVVGFANDCIGIYSKLRQLPLLITMQLEGLKLLTDTAVLLPTSPALCLAVESLLAKHLRELPPGQCVDIMESLCHHFQDNWLPKLQACCVGEAPKRKKRKKDGRMSTGAISAATTGGCEGLVAAVQKFVDLFGIVLSHVPLETFTGRVGERAISLLQRIHSEVCLPFLEACPSLPSDLQPPMCCASLHLASKCCQLQACLKAVFPDLLPSSLMLDQLFQLSSGKMVPQCWRDLPSMSMSQQCDYLLRELVILKLRFTTETSQEATFEDLVNFAFAPTTAFTDAPWTGQLLDINEANSCVANWSLVLPQQPLLYQLCSDTHLRQVAEFILQALLLAVRKEEDKSEEGTTCVGVAVSVLKSEGFASMRGLQELLLESIFVHAASSIPKWFSSELKEALFHCTEEEAEAFPQICNAIFSNILHHGLEALGANTASCHKRSRSINKWLNHLSAYLKLMRALPLSAMHPPVLTRSLVAVSVWHIFTAQLIPASHMTEVSADKVTAIMADLQYLMAWILHSLTTHQRRRGSKKKKQPDVQTALPIELLLQWLYKEQLDCKETKGNNLLASSLVAMEMAFGFILWQGEFNVEFTKTVVGELTHVVQSCNSSFYMEECLKAITHLTCKIYQQLGPGHKYSHTLQVALQQLLEMLTDLLEQISRSEPSGGPACHPAVVSSFVTVIYCRSDLISPRCLEMVTLLCTSTGLPSCLLAPKDRLTFCQQLEKLLGMLDVLSLPAAISQSSAVKDAIETELPTELQVLTSWKRLLEVLGYIFDQSGCSEYSTILAPMKGAKSRSVVSSETVNIGCQDNLQEGMKIQVCTKIFCVMSQLLAAASREETASIFDQIIQLDSSSVVSVCVFCCCWHVVLDSKLSQESRRELRKWLTRVLLKCEVIASLHQSSATHAVTMATQLATRLVALPQQVGLDRRSVVVSLHLCSSLETSTTADLRMRMQLAESVAQLVTAVIRNHSTVAISCAGPMMFTLNKLLHAVIGAGQMVEEGTSVDCDLALVVHCASLVTRVMETLSSHKAFTKFVPYSIGEFVTTAQKGPVNTSVKKALLPGVFSLLKLCTDHDLAFVKASLDLATRESLQALTAEYQKFYKFSGKV